MGKLPEPVEDVDYYREEVILDLDGNPFDHARWLRDKLSELNLNADGEPLRPGEIERPTSETTLEAFIKGVQNNE